MNLKKGKLYYNPENLFEVFFFNGTSLESLSGKTLSPSNIKAPLKELSDYLNYMSMFETGSTELRKFAQEKYFSKEERFIPEY